MDRVKILKKLKLVRHYNTNLMNSNIYYRANIKNPLIWFLFALYAFVLIIPYIMVGLYSALCSMYSDFNGLFNVNEKIRYEV